MTSVIFTCVSPRVRARERERTREYIYMASLAFPNSPQLTGNDRNLCLCARAIKKTPLMHFTHTHTHARAHISIHVPAHVTLQLEKWEAIIGSRDTQTDTRFYTHEIKREGLICKAVRSIQLIDNCCNWQWVHFFQTMKKMFDWCMNWDRRLNKL